MSPEDCTAHGDWLKPPSLRTACVSTGTGMLKVPTQDYGSFTVTHRYTHCDQKYIEVFSFYKNGDVYFDWCTASDMCSLYKTYSACVFV